jgi:hypothetical protein
MNINDIIDSVSDDLCNSILNDSIIDKNTIIVKIRASIRILISQLDNDAGIQHQYLQTKISEYKKRNKKYIIERDFWKKIAKAYIGENINQYYDRLDVALKDKAFDNTNKNQKQWKQ